MPLFKQSTSTIAAAESATPVVSLSISSASDDSATQPSTSFWPRLFGLASSSTKPAEPNSGSSSDSIIPNQKVMVVSEDSNGFVDVQVRALSYAEKASLSYLKNPQKYAAPKDAIQMSLEAMYSSTGSSKNEDGFDGSCSLESSINSLEYRDDVTSNTITSCANDGTVTKLETLEVCSDPCRRTRAGLRPSARQAFAREMNEYKHSMGMS